MISLAPTLPPIEHDNALRLALIYLNAAADPAAAKERLGQLAQHRRRNCAMRSRSTRPRRNNRRMLGRRWLDLEQRATELAYRDDGLIKTQTQLHVASSALASRDEALKSHEAAHALREDDLAKRVAELDRRVESYRAALAG